MTSQPIRLSTNLMTLIPSLTFTDYEWFPWSICNGCGMPAGNAYPSGHLVPSPILVLANAPIVETKFLELAMSLLDFSPRIPLGTFSILLMYRSFVTYRTRFSEDFSYIIQLRQKDSRQSYVTLLYVTTYKLYLKSEQQFCLCTPKNRDFFSPFLTWEIGIENVDIFQVYRDITNVPISS